MGGCNVSTKEVDIKGSPDNWRPWKRPREVIAKELRTMDVDEVVPAMGVTKKQELQMPPLRSPTGKRGIKVGGERKLKGGIKLKEERKDEVQCIGPKAAVMELLEKAKQEEAFKTEQEKKKAKVKLSLIEKEMNREIWRMGMLDRVKKEKVPVEHWGSINSGNFKILIGECAPHAVRVAVVKDLGGQKLNEWLYQELMKYYDKR